MNLLAHRGLWKLPEDKNSLHALSAAFKLGIGIETDIRDCDGTLVVSHDPPLSSNSLRLDVLLEAYSEQHAQSVLALNIKSDGLHPSLLSAIERHNIKNYFIFDMSIPDTLGYLRLKMPCAARISEYEPNSALAKNATWIWLDSFYSEWFDISLIQSWLVEGKRVAVVSPELHHRPYLPLWRKLKSLHDQSQVFLCTDFVMEAQEFFDEDKN